MREAQALLCEVMHHPSDLPSIVFHSQASPTTILPSYCTYSALLRHTYLVVFDIPCRHIKRLTPSIITNLNEAEKNRLEKHFFDARNLGCTRVQCCGIQTMARPGPPGKLSPPRSPLLIPSQRRISTRISTRPAGRQGIWKWRRSGCGPAIRPDSPSSSWALYSRKVRGTVEREVDPHSQLLVRRERGTLSAEVADGNEPKREGTRINYIEGTMRRGLRSGDFPASCSLGVNETPPSANGDSVRSLR